MLRNIYIRALLSFIGAGLVASFIVLAIQDHQQAPRDVQIASANTESQPRKVAPLPTPGSAHPLREPAEPALEERSRVPEVGSDSAPRPESTPEPQREAVEPNSENPEPKHEAPEAPNASAHGSGLSTLPPAPAPAPAPASPPSAPPRVAEPEFTPPAPAPVPTTPKVTTPPPPRVINSVVLGTGTPIVVRLDQTISTRNNRAGQTFSGVLAEPIVVNGFVAAERGAKVEGRITRAEGSSRIRGLARLSVVLTALNASGGQHLSLNSYPVEVEGQNIVGLQSVKKGASTTVGAVVGAVAGRTPGSALGSLVDGVIGTSGAILTGGKPAVLWTQEPVSFRLREPVSITERDATAGQ